MGRCGPWLVGPPVLLELQAPVSQPLQAPGLAARGGEDRALQSPGPTRGRGPAAAPAARRALGDVPAAPHAPAGPRCHELLRAHTLLRQRPRQPHGRRGTAQGQSGGMRTYPAGSWHRRRTPMGAHQLRPMVAPGSWRARHPWLGRLPSPACAGGAESPGVTRGERGACGPALDGQPQLPALSSESRRVCSEVDRSPLSQVTEGR